MALIVQVCEISCKRLNYFYDQQSRTALKPTIFVNDSRTLLQDMTSKVNNPHWANLPTNAKSLANRSSCNTTIGLIAAGVLAMDRELLSEVSSEMFLFLLKNLDTNQGHTYDSQRNCNSVVCDIMSNLARIIEKMYDDVHSFSKAGGLVYFLPFLESKYFDVCL